MKTLIVVTLLVLTLSASAMTPSQKNLMDFGLGIMMGLNITTRVPDLINCVFENSTQIKDSLESVVDDFKSFKLRDAVEDVKTFLSIFKDGTCGSAKIEGKEFLDDVLEGFFDPVKAF